MTSISSNRWFGGLSFLIVVGYFVAGFWPFEFRAPNHVSWLTGRSGLRFDPYGIAHDPAPLPDASMLGNTGTASANFTVELWVETRHEPSDDIAAILTIHNPALPHDFTLGQWKSDFLLRATLQSPQPSRRVPESGVDNSLPPGKPRFFAVRGDSNGTDFYVNGTLAGQFPHFVLNGDALNGQLIVGNSASGKLPWTGQLLGLAIYDRALDPATITRHCALWTKERAGELSHAAGLRALYLFNERVGPEAHDLSASGHHLVIPAIFEPVSRPLLIPPWKDLSYRHLDYSDIGINVLGFAPFGFCFYIFCRSSKWRQPTGRILLVVITGAAMSLTIEMVQAWLPNRTSSLMDLLANSAGTLLGVMVALAMEWGKRPGDPVRH